MSGPWLWLGLAIVLEVSGTTCMKWSNGFQNVGPTIAVGVFYLLSLAALTVAIKNIDLSLAYAVWAGAGTALVAIIGMALFRESVSPTKILAIALIIAGAVLLHVAETPAPSPATSSSSGEG